MGTAIQNVRYETLHADTPREVVNEAVCSLCEQVYLKTPGDIGICGRKLCRDAYAKSDKLQRENLAKLPPRRPYQVRWKA
jgi:hypothetical protein